MSKFPKTLTLLETLKDVQFGSYSQDKKMETLELSLDQTELMYKKLRLSTAVEDTFVPLVQDYQTNQISL